MNVIVEDLPTAFPGGMHNMNPSIGWWKGKCCVVSRRPLSHATPADFVWEGYKAFITWPPTSGSRPSQYERSESCEHRIRSLTTTNEPCNSAPETA
jgi:hypothetical protein